MREPLHSSEIQPGTIIVSFDQFGHAVSWFASPDRGEIQHEGAIGIAYADLSHEELVELKAQLEEEYAAIKAKGLALNMARGKPGADQLDLSEGMLSMVITNEDCKSAAGADCRNYSTLDGLPEAQELLASMLDDDPANIMVGGNSSLTLMYHVMTFCLDYGTLGSKPWCQ